MARIDYFFNAAGEDGRQSGPQKKAAAQRLQFDKLAF
jgi:hypothetical protein